MGVQVAITLDSEIKPSYAVSTVLAPAFAVAAADLVLWVGNAHAQGKHFEITALRKCLNRIRDNGATTPTSGNHSFAKLAAPGYVKDVSSGFNVTDLTLLTGTVTVSAGTKLVVGVGTTFTDDLVVGQILLIEAEYRVIDTITDDLNLALTVNHTGGAAGDDYSRVALTQLTGSMTVTAASNAVLGVDTLFDTELVAGTSVLLLEGEYIGVTTVTDDLNIVLAANHVGGAAEAALTGTVSVTINEADVVGVGTDFEAELVAGESIIEIATEFFTVLSIADDENLVLSAVHTAGASGATANLQPRGELATPTLLTGTVSVGAGTATVTGVGTTFTADLSVGDVIKIGSELIAILSITNPLALVLAANHTAGASGVEYSVSNTPAELDVGIWYGDLFQQSPGSSLTPHVLRGIEKYLESTQKSAG